MRLAAAAIILWLVVIALITTMQRRLVFLGYRSGPKTPYVVPPERQSTGRLFAVEIPDPGANAKEVINGWLALESPDSDPVRGVQGGRPLVLYFGGNASNRTRRLRSTDLFNALGANVLIADYRGYADNEGQPSEEAFVADARAVWQFARETLGMPAGQIVLCGESLGGGVAVQLAAQVCRDGEPPAGLMLRATFASLVQTAAYHYPFAPVRLLLMDRFESHKVIGDVTCPVIHFHGRRDNVVPYRHGRELFAAVPEASESGIPKRFVTLENAGHNDILWRDAEAYQRASAEFLRSLGFTPRSAGSTP